MAWLCTHPVVILKYTLLEQGVEERKARYTDIMVFDQLARGMKTHPK